MNKYDYFLSEDIINVSVSKFRGRYSYLEYPFSFMSVIAKPIPTCYLKTGSNIFLNNKKVTNISLHLIEPPKLQICIVCLTYVYLKLALVYRMVVLSKPEAIEAHLVLIQFEHRFDFHARVHAA